MKKVNKFLMLGFCFMLLPNNVNAQIKNETVFSKMNYYGVNNNTIVNNHLFVKNKDEINDNSDLLNILNINGEEKYYVTDGKLTWENNGKDIFYQGTTNKDLPITTQITYYLDVRLLLKYYLLIMLVKLCWLMVVMKLYIHHLW